MRKLTRTRRSILPVYMDRKGMNLVKLDGKGYVFTDTELKAAKKRHARCRRQKICK
ncbi:unnamed protein product [marine sediment metagenome]|uniref:Uncharacterized protein n=1 Tax=marine sediment metagenome TaxID=412755 RepID=X1BDT9_9ZZZZ